MTKFKDYYETAQFNEFKNFIKKNYKMNLVISHFESFLIYMDKKNIHEIKFDINFENECASESLHIINLCMLLNKAREDHENETKKYLEETIYTEKLIKVKKIFSKAVSAKMTNEQVTYTRRDKFYKTYDILVHEECLKEYELYPA